MNELWKMVLSLSLSGSLLTAALLALRPVLRNRVSKRWQYYIWLAVIARLLLPLSPEDSPVGRLFQQEEPALAGEARILEGESVSIPGGPAGDWTPAPTPAADPAPETAPADPEPGETPRDWAALRQHLWGVWLGGALLLLVRRVTAYQGFARYMRAGGTAVSDPVRLDRLAELAERAGVQRPVELAVNPLAASPLLLGLRRPCIVLPSLELSEEALTCTLLHELTHLRRRDLAYKWLVQGTVCVHWFNPLVWWMSREIGRACELSCDEAVLRILEAGERRAYGDTLLQALESGGRLEASWASVTLSENGKLLKERLTAIMNFKQSTRRMRVLSLILAAALLTGAAAAGAYTGPAETPQTSGRTKACPAAKTAGLLDEDEWERLSRENRYTEEVYLQLPYCFKIGWNVQSGSGDISTGQRLSLSDGSALWLFFSDTCETLPNQPAALAALKTVLERLRQETKDTEFPLTRPVVLEWQSTAAAAPGELAEWYYKEENLAFFLGAFAQLDRQAQEAWAARCWEDGRTAFFGGALDRLTGGGVPEELVERIYESGSTSGFAIAASHMEESQRKAWLARTEREGNVVLRSILIRQAGTAEEQRQLEAEEAARKAEQEAKRLEEYRALGITGSMGNWQYQGQTVKILLDLRENSSFITLDQNPKGTVDIKITRDEAGEIQGVAPLSEAERVQLFGDGAEDADCEDDWDDWEDDWDDWEDWDDWNALSNPPSAGEPSEVLPVNLSVLGGENSSLAWLGTVTLSYGDLLRYDVAAETGEGLQVGLAKRTGSHVSAGCYVATGFDHAVEQVFSPPVEEGEYQVFVRSAKGERLTNVRGSVTVTPGGWTGSELPCVRLSRENLPEAVERAMESCAIKTWYLIHAGERQYLWYNGAGWDYSWKPSWKDGGWKVEIGKGRQLDSGYVLLALAEAGPVSVYLDGEPVTLTKIDV